jgi:amino acid adenylation domain-containing protein
VTDLADLLASLAKQGVVVWGEGNRLRFRASKGALTDAMRAQLAANRDLVLDTWRQRAANEIVSHPASHGQRGLWFLYRLNPESAAYNVVFSTRIRSEIDPPALQRAFQALVDRHPSLRTSFCEESDHLVQRVCGYLPVCFSVHSRPGIDLNALREEVYESSLAPFDLEKGPLMRVDLYSREADDYILLLTVHHIVADGWSLFLLLDDLRRLYSAERVEGIAPVPRPTQNVFDYSRWQENMLAGPDGRAHEDYWLSKFSGVLPLLSMPTDRPRQAAKSVQGASLSIDLGVGVSDAIRKLAAREGTTPFVVLLTAYQVLLHRYTGQQEVIVGTPTYGRDRAEFANVVGDFINMIPLRVAFNGDPPFRELLGRVRQCVVEGIEHQDYPFPLLVEKLQPVRSFTQTPIFQTAFMLQKFKEVAGLEKFFGSSRSNERAEYAGLLLEPFPIPQQEGQFELSLELAESDGVFQGTLKYDANLFAGSSVRQLAGQYVTLLEGITVSPETTVSRLRLITEDERTNLVDGLNKTTREYVLDWTVVDFIRAQTAQRPGAEAVKFEGTSLTFEQLDVRSTQLARHLQSLGVGSESLVGVYLERGQEMLIGLLGVLKAGCAYVPMDPAFPAERLRYMAEDSGIKALVTQAGLPQAPFAGTQISKVFLDEDKPRIEQHRVDPLPPLARPTTRAYVIYTSGSTGRPKGVEIEHRSLTNFLCSMADKPGLAETDVLLAVTTLAFDIAGLELFLPLITGARIELASRETAQDGTALGALLLRSGATVMQATPGTWRMLLESGWKGDRRLKVLCGGEVLDGDLATRLVATCGSVWNMYGPTETTIWSSVAQLESDEVTIGKPIANTQMYVLDGNREPVPRGVVGDLWIGGEGVARAYLNRAELTAERFLPNPFHKGGRMYWTGDLARYLPDGRLVYLGRSDTQIKIRGYRIELDEIITVLSSHPQVRECIVTADRARTDDARLVAYIVPLANRSPVIEDLRNHLRAVLPEYMIPSGFVLLDAIPKTRNGKVDRNALPAVEFSSLNESRGYLAPRNQVEKIMADAWAEVLGVEKVGIFDHFFELGGHSLSASRLIAQLKSAFQVELPLKSILIDPTVAGLSKHILYDEYTARYYYVGEISRWNRLVPAQPKGSRLPFFLVAGFMDADDTLRVISRLIPYLGLDQPIYGFQPRWLDGKSERYADAKEAALEFLTDLKSVQPEGPYLLGGDCAGGIVATVMAEELLRRGEEVRLLVLFDTHRPGFLRSLGLDLYYGWQRAKHIAEVLRQLAQKSHRARAELVQDLGRRKFGGDQNKTKDELAASYNYKLRMDYMRTMYSHKLKRYSGKLTLIINEYQQRLDKTMGWRQGDAQGGLEIHLTPGDHWTRYLHGREFAERLIDCIHRSSPEYLSQENRSARVSEPGPNGKIEFVLRHRCIKC